MAPKMYQTVEIGLAREKFWWNFFCIFLQLFLGTHFTLLPSSYSSPGTREGEASQPAAFSPTRALGDPPNKVGTAARLDWLGLKKNWGLGAQNLEEKRTKRWSWWCYRKIWHDDACSTGVGNFAGVQLPVFLASTNFFIFILQKNLPLFFQVGIH